MLPFLCYSGFTRTADGRWGQQLLCAAPSFEDPQLFYRGREARNANAEVDFVISRHQDILPVEVKAGKTGTLRSLFGRTVARSHRRTVASVAPIGNRLYRGLVVRQECRDGTSALGADAALPAAS